MYKGVDGGITERRIGRSRPPVALFLPWGRFLASSSGRLRVGGDARGEGVSWFLVQLKSAAPVLAVGQIEGVPGCTPPRAHSTLIPVHISNVFVDVNLDNITFCSSR